jgi:hypothetical protein
MTYEIPNLKEMEKMERKVIKVGEVIELIP